MKKQIDTSRITSDLSGSSAFFPDYKKTPSPALQDRPELPEQAEASQQIRGAKAVQGVPLSLPRPVPRPAPLVRKVKRVMRQRQPFDIYEDQYEWLKSVAEAEKDFVNGRGMSQMVREAIDNYRRDHTSSKE